MNKGKTDMPVTSLKADPLYRKCDPSIFDFDTTDDLKTGDKLIGQNRLVSSIRFGVGMKQEGYNIFALGPLETDKQVMIQSFLEVQSADEDVPDDLCYVHNFDDPYKPQRLRIPPGYGSQLKSAMGRLIEELEATLRSAFESEEYQNRRKAVEEQVQQQSDQSFEELQQKAKNEGMAIVRTPAGFTFAPLKNGEIMSQKQIKKLSEEERQEIEEKTRRLQEELQTLLHKMPAAKRELRDRLKDLDREIATFAIKDLFAEINEKFDDLEQVRKFLDDVQKDIVDNVKAILSPQGGGQMAAFMQMQGGDQFPAQEKTGVNNPFLKNYQVNLLVDNKNSEGAPVVFEENPTYKNLFGRVEYKSRMGALTTDFTLIKSGALHRANGGYLVLEARSLLLEPFAWEGLKRTLKTGSLKIESPGESYGLISTVSLEPEPEELNLKVVLLGQRMLYYLLCAYDPEFRTLFKVEADFEDEIERNGENQLLYAQLLAALIRKNNLKAFNRNAVARIIEESARLTGDSEKLSTRTIEIENLLQQSHFWAGEQGRSVVHSEDVQKAIDQQEYRSGRLREKVQESIYRDTVYIDTSGEKSGQINGLSVIQVGNLIFGKPNRITARVQLGSGNIVDIEREVKMGGPIHSKGVLILKGFLGERYARYRPLSLSASLVFEQSYGGVDGDSASSAELYALLSAISGIPIRQSLAVTGSVNQHGEIQSIGGVNEKIEGFFDICMQDGLSGDQGVIIPKSNVKNLMLRHNVVEAVKAGEFHIYPVTTIDEGMELLTGLPTGERDADGNYPDGSLNYKVEEELKRMAEQKKLFTRNDGESGKENE